MRVSLFIPCAVDALLGDVAADTFLLLSALGFEVVYHEEQTCCGQPAISAGYPELVRDIAKRFIKIFEADEVIVSPSGSCVNTVKNDYAKILQDEPEWQQRALETGGRVYEISQFLVDYAGIEDVNASFTGKIAYHKSCHLLRALGIDEQPYKLLRQVKGAELAPLNSAEQCCGFGGQFSLKYPLISEVLVRQKTDNFLLTGAQRLIVSDPGCLLNIGGYLHRCHPHLQAQHIVSFLAQNMEGGKS
ncbi:MAG TPA: (Fe-S)-binding protein [Syntrophomonas sp.]|nr:(Fe-S)-binding protein [Syntrophomonas sp.]